MYQLYTNGDAKSADPATGPRRPELRPLVKTTNGSINPLDGAFLDRPVPSHNLPLQPTPLVGRAQALQTAREYLLSDDVRLLTLTGSAGVGKTRLALALADLARPHFPHGVWLVELAMLQDPAQVSSAIAQVLGLGEAGYRAQASVLQTHLKNRKLLLILDNFEQVLPAATQIAALLATCQDVKIVATSRTRLRLRWEHVRPVGPLAYRSPSTSRSIEAVAELPGVALFVQRAQASFPGFALTSENVEAVVALCEHLQGLPLAIELAAARANTLTPSELVEWIECSQPALGWDAQDLPERHQTLRAALEWSYALLTPAEQAMLRRLAAFAGGWTLDAAAEVTRVDELGLDPQVGLASLVDASLVQVSRNQDGESRFTMLDVLRELAGDLLSESGDGDETRERHAQYFSRLADRARRGLEGGGRQRQWLECLEVEHDNLRAALRWGSERGDCTLQLRLSGSLAFFWWVCGYLREGCEWLTRALACGPDALADARIGALEGLGLLSAHEGDFQTATDQIEEALRLANQLGEGHSPMRAVGVMIRIASLQGRHERLAKLIAELEAARSSADPWSLGFALHGLGLLAHEARDPASAATFLREGIALCREADDQFGLANALATLALVEHDRGDDGQAVALAADALDLAHRLRSSRTIARCVHVVIFLSGSWASATTLAHLLGAAETLRASVRFRLSPLHRSLIDGAVDATRERLGEETFAETWAEGRMMATDDFVATALATLAVAPSAEVESTPTRGEPRGYGGLSPREHEVLQHVAAGLTNRQIAEKLIISVATVNYHVTSVLNKLGADNRTQAVTIATQRGLCTDVPGMS